MKLTDEQEKIASESYRDFLLFFGVIFFTCMVGIIELLPEFENPIIPSWGWITISGLYFGLFFGSIYCIHMCFRILFEEVIELKKYGFRYPGFNVIIKRIFKTPVNFEIFIETLVVIGFFLLYLVKINVLQ